MKKQDLIIIAVLFGLLMAWPFVYKQWIEPRVAPPVYNQAPTNAALPPAVGTVTSAPPVAAAEPAEKRPESVSAPKAVAAPEEERPVANVPEEFATITNAGASIVVSSRGGGIVKVEFGSYRKSVAKDSGPAVMAFTNRSSMAYRGLSGFSAFDHFSIVSSKDGGLVLEAASSNGLKLVRTMVLNDKNQVMVSDLFTNTASQACTIPKHSVQLGAMQQPADDYRMSGINYLGIDVLPSVGGEDVIYWGGQLAGLFKTYMKEKQAPFLPVVLDKDENKPVDWIAVKNKFFTQILVPEGGADAYRLTAERVTVEGEDQNPALKPKSADIRSVAAAVVMAGRTLNGGEAFCQSFKLYLGPKKYSVLRTLGLRQEKVMEFGGFVPLLMEPISKFLLTVLNLIYSVIPNYGVAIILLTILIRIIFWPLTHKSTESMKRMQELQPLMNELKAKHKDNPRKMQEETMALYRKHKVNPVSGCLPMLIQIPVFIALFIVLRSAIELRFAPFLWINDLSAPERLFADILPIPLNILPIFMAATQAWQQILMPAGDPNQQKMMLFFMPVMMMVMFYMMPSALVLYWSANQCIVIVQQLIQKKRKASVPVPVKK